jgi:DNA ligase-3
MDSDKFFIEYAASSRSACKKCKLKLEKGVLRIGKLVANPFHEGDTMKSWYHAPCMFESLQRARATTKKIEKTEELEGFDLISDDDKDKVKKMIEDLTTIIKSKPQTKKKKAVHATLAAHQGTVNLKVVASDVATSLAASADTISTADDDEMKTQDNSFYRFSQLCGDIEAEASYKAKTEIVATYIKQGSSGDGFKGDLYLLVKLLLPGAVKRVYNLQNKQLLKLFSKIFGCDQDDMTEDMEQSGDVSDTVMKFFEESSSVTPVKRSTLSLVEVDQLLESLSGVTKEEEQEAVLRRITQRSTAKDIKYIVRLIKGDLRMNARSRHILDALDPNAYAAFQTSNDLQAVVDRLLTRQQSASSEGIPSLTRTLSVKVSLMTPVKPMLAEACKSVGMAMKKCPDGMYAEIKYDGERVQIHKKGNQYSFFSRTLKPVLKHKVEHVKDYLPQACPHGNSIILDSEVLLVDTKTGNPLPFGTLGIHKKSAFQDATVCLFVFDCLLFNDESLLDKSVIV